MAYRVGYQQEVMTMIKTLLLSLSQTQMVCLNRCRAYLISLLSLSEYLHACLN